MSKKSGFNYRDDPIGRVCLGLAKKSGSKIGFGAVLVKNGQIIGRGCNRLSTPWERRRLSHVDYAIHAEQACIIDALNHRRNVSGSEVYVVGMVLTGKNKGTLTVRSEKGYGCLKCPHTLERYNTPVNIPYVHGWVRLSPREAHATAKWFRGTGKWYTLVDGTMTL